LLNIVVLIIFALFLGFAHEAIGKIMGSLFGVFQKQAKVTLFRVFQQYRLMLVMFNFIHYIVLRFLM